MDHPDRTEILDLRDNLDHKVDVVGLVFKEIREIRDPKGVMAHQDDLETLDPQDPPVK